MHAPMLTGTLLVAIAVLGCGGTRRASGFPQIAPGMTSQQVYDLMGYGPSKAQEFKDGSVAWFYGENACVRLREDLVVAKEVTENTSNVHTPWGGMTQKRVAQCAPAGEAVESSQTRIYTPLGSVNVPTPKATGTKKAAGTQ